MKIARLTRTLIASIGFALLTQPLTAQAEVKIGVSDWPGWVAWPWSGCSANNGVRRGWCG